MAGGIIDQALDWAGDLGRSWGKSANAQRLESIDSQMDMLKQTKGGGKEKTVKGEKVWSGGKASALKGDDKKAYAELRDKKKTIAGDESKYGDYGQLGMKSGLVGAGLGAVSGAIFEDQSIIGGAFMGAAGGAALGMGTKAFKANRLATATEDVTKGTTKTALNKAQNKNKALIQEQGRAASKNQEFGTMERISATIEDKISKSGSKTLSPEAKSRRQMRAMDERVKKSNAEVQGLERKMESNGSIISNGEAAVNHYTTGSLAAIGSLAYATLSSNRY